MQSSTTFSTAEAVNHLSTRERVGLVVNGPDAATIVKTIVAAEAAGVQQTWNTQMPLAADILTTFASALVQTRSMRLGSAIVPTYPRHPLTMAAQALALNDLAPERLRLGIGPSHRPTIEGIYGLPMERPLDHLREYVEIVRGILWKGQIDYRGQFFTVKATSPHTAKIPILTSTLRENAFSLAGEVSDGAISWLCPTPYLLKTGLPALKASAQQHNRPVPPLVAHVLVSVSEDHAAVMQATRKQISRYGKLPFYAHMFADAGFPVGENGELPDALINSLVISGSKTAITDRLKELLASGLNELLILPVPIKQADSALQHLMQLTGQL